MAPSPGRTKKKLHVRRIDTGDAITLTIGTYRISIRRGEVVIHDTLKNAIYAVGTWIASGGYVRYPGDGFNKRYSWALLDTVDHVLRDALDWKHQSSKVDMPGTLAIRDQAVRMISPWDG